MDLFNLCECTFTAAAAAAVSYSATYLPGDIHAVALCQSSADIYTLCPARQLGTAALNELIKTRLCC